MPAQGEPPVIPKILHYVWVGPNPLPEDARKRIAQWRALLPEWTFMFWHEGNIDYRPRFVRQATGGAYNRVANYVRLVALRDHGGFYFDHDIALARSIDPLREYQGVLGFQTDDPQATDLINGAVMGAVRNHPFICQAVAALDAMAGGFAWGSGTGPGLLTRLLRESGSVKPSDEPFVNAGMTLFPPRAFYPYPHHGTFTTDCVTRDTYTIHLWHYTWAAKSGFVWHFKRKARRALTLISPSLMCLYVRTRDRHGKPRGPAEGEPAALTASQMTYVEE